VYLLPHVRELNGKKDAATPACTSLLRDISTLANLHLHQSKILLGYTCYFLVATG
jgi:hypothetical protein